MALQCLIKTIASFLPQYYNTPLTKYFTRSSISNLVSTSNSASTFYTSQVNSDGSFYYEWGYAQNDETQLGGDTSAPTYSAQAHGTYSYFTSNTQSFGDYSAENSGYTNNIAHGTQSGFPPSDSDGWNLYHNWYESHLGYFVPPPAYGSYSWYYQSGYSQSHYEDNSGTTDSSTSASDSWYVQGYVTDTSAQYRTTTNIGYTTTTTASTRTTVSIIDPFGKGMNPFGASQTTTTTHFDLSFSYTPLPSSTSTDTTYTVPIGTTTTKTVGASVTTTYTTASGSSTCVSWTTADTSFDYTWAVVTNQVVLQWGIYDINTVIIPQVDATQDEWPWAIYPAPFFDPTTTGPLTDFAYSVPDGGITIVPPFYPTNYYLYPLINIDTGNPQTINNIYSGIGDLGTITVTGGRVQSTTLEGTYYATDHFPQTSATFGIYPESLQTTTNQTYDIVANTSSYSVTGAVTTSELVVGSSSTTPAFQFWQGDDGGISTVFTPSVRPIFGVGVTLGTQTNAGADFLGTVARSYSAPLAYSGFSIYAWGQSVSADAPDGFFTAVTPFWQLPIWGTTIFAMYPEFPFNNYYTYQLQPTLEDTSPAYVGLSADIDMPYYGGMLAGEAGAYVPLMYYYVSGTDSSGANRWTLSDTVWYFSWDTKGQPSMSVTSKQTASTVLGGFTETTVLTSGSFINSIYPIGGPMPTVTNFVFKSVTDTNARGTIFGGKTPLSIGPATLAIAGAYQYTEISDDTNWGTTAFLEWTTTSIDNSILRNYEKLPFPFVLQLGDEAGDTHWTTFEFSKHSTNPYAYT